MTDFVIRPLTVDDNRDEYADLAIRAFGQQDPASIWVRSEPAIADGRGLGAFDDGRLVGSALFHDLRQWWLGRAIPVAGVAGVKVAPELRGRGAGRALMTALTELMISRGYPLTVLYAATMPIYRQLGWEAAGVKYDAEIPARSLQDLVRPEFPAAGPPPLRRPGPADAGEIVSIIGRVHELAGDCGPITFSEPVVWYWLTAPGVFTYVAPDGFLAYRWSGGGHEELVVEKLVAASPETTRALWSVLASHSSIARRVRVPLAPADPIWWLLREQDAKRVAMRKHWMLRLLAAPAAIAARGFPLADLTVPLRITDDQVPANSGDWTLATGSGSGQLTRGCTGSPLHLGARGLAALYAGTPVATLRRAGLAAGGTPDGDAALDTAFAASAFMIDDF